MGLNRAKRRTSLGPLVILIGAATIYRYGDHSITAKDGEPLNRGFKIPIYLEKKMYDRQKWARMVKDGYCLPTTKYHCPSTTTSLKYQQKMPSTRASKSTTRSGLCRQSSPPPSTVSSARKRATSSVIDTTQAKKTKVDDEIPENQTKNKKKDEKKDRKKDR